ncbi:hypothetical protein [Burkholderia anthina]|uniref:hypothetical protein n=1 Tax=Burkholderia anthina TaxID=179879 RepID=UPI0037BF467B
MHRTPLTFFSIALAILLLAKGTTLTRDHHALAFMAWQGFSLSMSLGILWYVAKGLDWLFAKIDERRSK